MLVILSIALVACASQPTPPPQPDHLLAVEIHTDNYQYAVAAGSDNTAVILLVRNQSANPLTVQAIEVKSIDTPYFSLVPIRKTFDQSILPGATASFKLWSMSNRNDAVRKVPNYRPVILVAAIDARTDGTAVREIFRRQID